MATRRPAAAAAPRDLGWAWQIGVAPLADRLRTWSTDGRILAVGFLDGPTLLRLAIAPGAGADPALAERIAADIADPARGILPAGPASIEAGFGDTLRGAAAERRLVRRPERAPAAGRPG